VIVQKFQLKNLKFRKNRNKGMTYVELIVVLSIFSVLSAVSMFNYGKFQAKIDIKNLASDIALKIVEAQKSSIGGLLPPNADPDWKPSYGVYFNRIANNKSFIYFADASGDRQFQVGEEIRTMAINKGNLISSIKTFPEDLSLGNFTISFARPDSGAKMFGDGIELVNTSWVEITVESPSEPQAIIRVYPSGRLETQ